MRTLVYIGEQYPAQAAPYVKQFHDKETGQQLDYMQLSELLCTEEVNIRPATAEEMESVWAATCTAVGALAFLAELIELGADAQPHAEQNTSEA